MQILPVQNYSNKVYCNKNIKKQSSNVSFQGVNAISGKTFNQSKKLAEEAIELCEKLFGKFPAAGDVALVPKEYLTRAKEYFEYLKFEKPSLTLCKKYGNKEAILYVEQPPRYYEAVHGTGKVNLFIHDGGPYPVNITFDKEFLDGDVNSEVNKMISEKKHKDSFFGIMSSTKKANEEDAQIFNEYVSDILKSSEKLVKTFK